MTKKSVFVYPTSKTTSIRSTNKIVRQSHIKNYILTMHLTKKWIEKDNHKEVVLWKWTYWLSGNDYKVTQSLKSIGRLYYSLYNDFSHPLCTDACATMKTLSVYRPNLPCRQYKNPTP